MYAVTGATGNVGMALTRILIARGRQVRALHRDPAKSEFLRALGAEPVLASVEDGGALEMAFQGAEGVFAMTPPFYRSHDPRNENALAVASIVHALRAAHVSKVVLLSSIGAEQERGTGAVLKLHDLEQAAAELKQPVAAIRAAYFMENLKPLIGVAKSTGKLPVMTEDPGQAFDMVATKDIAELAADLLMEGWNGQKTIELSGPRQYSMRDAAAVISKITGRAVEPDIVPPAERQAFYEHAGFTPASAATMAELSAGMNAGLLAFHGGSGVDARKGSTTLEEVLSAG